MDLFNLKKEEKRESVLIGFIGYNRTGKTTLMRPMIEEYKKSYPNNEIVVYDPQGRFSDLAHEKIINENDIFNILEKRDCLVILDDYDTLFDHDRVKGAFKELLQLRVEYGFDIFFSTHHVNFIKQGMSPFISHLYLFYTNLTKKIVGLDNKVPNADLIEFLSKEVVKEVKIYGKGEYEEQNFKHIIYENESGSYKYVNFESTIDERIKV